MESILTRDLVLSSDFRKQARVQLPEPEQLDLPEKAVQFGTGALLRGFVDYFLDEANRQGRFGGRVVMVGSTGSGRTESLNRQDGLYTLSIQGIRDGAPHQEHRVISSVSRALSARDQWDEVLACARNPELELIFSNTTEVGIVLDEEDAPDLAPPRSFPGKLTRFLLERARAFDFDPDKGVVVLPCELIEDNGTRLREIVLALAERWELEEEFSAWVRSAVPFCDTLVDRIVPGNPQGEQAEQLRRELGYRDDMHTMCEVYRLFAIEAEEPVRARLGFAEADPGIVVTDDVRPYRERKVRLLNGSHTIMVPAALLAGCQTVLSAVQDRLVGRFLRQVMLEEIVPTLDVPGAPEFAHEVLDRFANPYIRHELFDITLQATMKMRVRNVPTILRFAEQTGRAPDSFTFGFAAFLLFMRGELQDQRRAAGLRVPADDQGASLRALWNRSGDLDEVARAACSSEALWGTDLTRVPGFVEAVGEHLRRISREGVAAALEAHLEAVPVTVA